MLRRYILSRLAPPQMVTMRPGRYPHVFILSGLLCSTTLVQVVGAVGSGVVVVETQQWKMNPLCTTSLPGPTPGWSASDMKRQSTARVPL